MKVNVRIHFEDGRTVDMVFDSYQELGIWEDEHYEEGIEMIVAHRVDDEEVDTD